MADIIRKATLCFDCGCSQTLPEDLQTCNCRCHPMDRQRPHTGSHPLTETTCDDPGCWCHDPFGEHAASITPIRTKEDAITQGAREYRAGYRGPFSEDVVGHQWEMNRIQSGLNEIGPTLDRIHDQTKYEICITIMEPYASEVRLPPITGLQAAWAFARIAKYIYPNALIEIAHDGIREGL